MIFLYRRDGSIPGTFLEKQNLNNEMCFSCERNMSRERIYFQSRNLFLLS